MNETITYLNGTNILVIGDLTIDQYLSGTVTRISPEALAPIVNIETDVCKLDGAINAVNNINNLGGIVEAVGVIEKRFNHPLIDSGLEGFLNDWKSCKNE